MYWYASVCPVTSPEQYSREISFKLSIGQLIMMDRIMFSNMELSNMYRKPQENLDWVNMSKGDSASIYITARIVTV